MLCLPAATQNPSLSTYNCKPISMVSPLQSDHKWSTRGQFASGFRCAGEFRVLARRLGGCSRTLRTRSGACWGLWRPQQQTCARTSPALSSCQSPGLYCCYCTFPALPLTLTVGSSLLVTATGEPVFYSSPAALQLLSSCKSWNFCKEVRLPGTGMVVSQI